MGIYLVYMYTVRQDAVTEHDTKALPALLEHIKREHPRILSMRTWTLRVGSEPARLGRILMEEYASFTAIDEVEAKEATPGCTEAWNGIHALVVPGSFKSAMWADPLRAHWKEPSL